MHAKLLVAALVSLASLAHAGDHAPDESTARRVANEVARTLDNAASDAVDTVSGWWDKATGMLDSNFDSLVTGGKKEMNTRVDQLISLLESMKEKMKQVLGAMMPASVEQQIDGYLDDARTLKRQLLNASEAQLVAKKDELRALLDKVTALSWNATDEAR